LAEDKRKYNGGHKTAGRKPKADEQKLIEKLSPLAPMAHEALKTAIENNEQWAVKLFFEYFYGKPKQSVDVTTDGDKINTPQQIAITVHKTESDE
jgi:hypothetical protein